MERLFFHPTPGPTPPPAEYPGARSVSFESADGTALHGWFVPARSGAASAATILHVHGNAGNIESHAWFTEYLPVNGFNVFIFDYRGYGQSAGSARRRGPLIADTHAALDALLREPDVDASRVGLYGQSLGGAIGLAVMADRPEIRAAVIESAFDSWRGIAANAVGGEPPNALGRFMAACLIGDGDRPIDAIRRIDRPILIVHGSDDSIIPISHGRRLADSAPNARLEILPGGDHNTLRSTHPEIEAMVVEFLRERVSD
jgi:pimeloyl-ACP methyl ester carboxylesterase